MKPWAYAVMMACALLLGGALFYAGMRWDDLQQARKEADALRTVGEVKDEVNQMDRDTVIGRFFEWVRD